MGASDIESSTDEDEENALLRSRVAPSGKGVTAIGRGAPRSRRGVPRGRRNMLIACSACTACALFVFMLFAFEGTTRNVALSLLGGAGLFKGRRTWMKTYIVEPHFVEWIEPTDRILDFGAGSGMLNSIVNELGFHNLVSVDIDGVDFYGDREQFRYYDGMHLPLKAGAVDATIILSVLHHIPPGVCSELLHQLSKITRKLLVIEDCWDTVQANGKMLGKRAFDFWDSFYNFEWTRHPHNSHSLPEWVDFFEDHGFKVVKTDRHKESPWGHTFISMESTNWVDDGDKLAAEAWDPSHCSSATRSVCAPGPTAWKPTFESDATARNDAE